MRKGARMTTRIVRLFCLLLIFLTPACTLQEVAGGLGSAAGVALVGGDLKEVVAGATGSTLASSGTRHAQNYLGHGEQQAPNAANNNGGGLTMLKKKGAGGEQMAVDGNGNVFVLVGGQWVKSND